MSTNAQVKTPAKTPVAPAAARIPQPPVPELEHEAERPDIAAQLEGAARLGHSLGAVGVDGPGPPIIQRQEIPEEEEEELQLKRMPAAVQRQELPEEEEELMMKPEIQRVGVEGGSVSAEVEAAIQRARGGGQSLDRALQIQMSKAPGHDFSRVRVHTDAEADDLNQQLNARAFTTGQDIFFRQGEYVPGSGSGRELIAHELSHVVQQSSGRVNGRASGMTVRPAGDAFEQEADRVAEAVTKSRKLGAAQWSGEVDPQAQEGAAGSQTQESESQPATVSEDCVFRINTASGSGLPLAATYRKHRMHSTWADRSDVSVHPVSASAALDRKRSAKVITNAPDICSKRGGLAPDMRSKQRADDKSALAPPIANLAPQRPLADGAGRAWRGKGPWGIQRAYNSTMRKFRVAAANKVEQGYHRWKVNWPFTRGRLWTEGLVGCVAVVVEGAPNSGKYGLVHLDAIGTKDWETDRAYHQMVLDWGLSVIDVMCGLTGGGVTGLVSSTLNQRDNVLAQSLKQKFPTATKLDKESGVVVGRAGWRKLFSSEEPQLEGTGGEKKSSG